MFKRPNEVSLRHFDILYRTFQRRFWVLSSNESACREQCIELLDYLRTNYPSDFKITDAAQDLIEFLTNLEFLQAREHLFYLLKLCCLCITSASPTHPTVTIGSVNTSGYWDRFTDFVLSGQSYLSSVPESIAFCTNDANLAHFSLLSAFSGVQHIPLHMIFERVSITLAVQRSTNHFWLLIVLFILGLVEAPLGWELTKKVRYSIELL